MALVQRYHEHTLDSKYEYFNMFLSILSLTEALIIKKTYIYREFRVSTAPSKPEGRGFDSRWCRKF